MIVMDNLSSKTQCKETMDRWSHAIWKSSRGNFSVKFQSLGVIIGGCGSGFWSQNYASLSLKKNYLWGGTQRWCWDWLLYYPDSRDGWGWARAKARSQECSLGFQCRWQEPSYWSHHCCLAGSALAESWDQEPAAGIEPRYSDTECQCPSC